MILYGPATVKQGEVLCHTNSADVRAGSCRT
jgi:hypothetical protein